MTSLRIDTVRPWEEVEIALAAEHDDRNPYTDAALHADFSHESGLTLRRPGFWDGGRSWRIRFAAPVAGRWTWRTESAQGDPGLGGRRGDFVCAPAARAEHRFYRHGFWRMSPGAR